MFAIFLCTFVTLTSGVWVPRLKCSSLCHSVDQWKSLQRESTVKLTEVNDLSDDERVLKRLAGAGNIEHNPSPANGRTICAKSSI